MRLAAEVDFFLEHGYLVVKHAFSPDKAAEFTKDMWVRLGMDPDDPATWDHERVHMPVLNREPVATFAPKVWEIMKELLGGEDRIDAAKSMWGDSFIVNFGPPSSPPASSPPSPRARAEALDNWHVDGDFFVHYLDSPEQALLVTPLFSDIAPGGGATWIAPRALDRVARYLARHPEGVRALAVEGEGGVRLPAFVPCKAGTDEPDWEGERLVHAENARRELLEDVGKDGDGDGLGGLVELTGETGDVVLMHPLMPHSASRNHLRVPRVITNPPATVREPFSFRRGEGEGEYSLVERQTLRALGRNEQEGFAWRMGGERRGVVPERVGLQARMIEQERRRLEAAREARERLVADAGGAAVRAVAVA
ncbi:hypothetical protein C8Q76DRAFT_735544 [Earliella scabrosa]|nr:hypothetical protein C8Q76DRAFT_735544 [Earliella scabrosa]